MKKDVLTEDLIQKLKDLVKLQQFEFILDNKTIKFSHYVNLEFSTVEEAKQVKDRLNNFIHEELEGMTKDLKDKIRELL